MQHIAPLQTDFAAKPAGDVALDAEQMWLGTGGQAQGEGGQAFNQVLTSEKRAQQNKQASKNSSDTVTQPQAKSVEQKSESAPDVNGATVDAKSGEKHAAESSETDGSVAVDKVADAKATSGSEEDVVPLPIIVKEVPVNPELNPQAEVSQEEFNWVDLVEQVQTLAKTEPARAQQSEGSVAGDDSVEPSDFIDELQVTPEEITLQEVGQPTLVVQLPTDTDKKVAQTETAVELVLDINKQIEALSTKPGDIENDLYIAPIEALTDVIAEQSVSDEEPAESEPLVSLLTTLLDTESKADTDSDTDTDSVLSSAPDVDLLADAEVATVTEQTPIIVNPQQLTIQPQNNDKAAVDIVLKGSEEQQLRAVETVTQLLSDSSKTPLTENQQQSFVAALQAGISEYKEQLKQGREPGISLKSLVNEALVAAEVPTTNQTDVTISKVTEQVAQTLVLADAVQQLRRNSDELVRQAQVRIDSSSLDVAQQTEGQRSTQSQAVLDKPANILKPEGQTQFAEKIRWIVNARNSFAEIRLDPPELGSVQVKVNMAGEAAAVSFVVQSQQARDALDQALPRLRDMLNQQGIELGQSSVQQDNQQQQGEQQQGQFAEGKADDGMDEIAGEVIEQRVVNGRAGGIDFYA